MKQAILSFIFAFISILSTGQITGGFFYGTDIWGSTFVYFKGTNMNQHNVQIEIKCVNELLEEEQSWNCKLAPGNHFTVGPSDDWIWLPGEKLIITYPNGASFYWVYAPQQDYYNNNNYNNPLNSTTPVTTEQNKTCYTCHGTGSCNVCHGTGRYSLFGNSSTCSGCGGDGKCWHCHGTRKQ